MLERFILASASPARKKLLRDAGFRFDVVPSNSRETLRGPLRRCVLENARRKARAVARRHPGRWVLAADTLAGFRGRIFGKPRDPREAERILTTLRGKTHDLATAAVLLRGGEEHCRVAVTRVRMRNQSPEAIRRIVQRYDPTKLAGGYAIRAGTDPLVERIHGSFSNVVGLPMEAVAPLLKRRLRPLRTRS